MIRKILLGSSMLLTLSTMAMAADLPSRVAPPVFAPPPVFSWAGFYIGGQIGYEFGNDAFSVLGNPFGSGRSSGVIGGGHAGYNYVIPGFGFGSGLVVGVEGDVDGSDESDNSTFDGINPFFHVRSDIQGSVRGRVGLAFDRALFYATGGAAFGSFHTTFEPFGVAEFGKSNTRTGYTVGGGVEYAITPNWSLRAEYRYSDYGSFDVGPPGAPFLFREKSTDNQVTVGFSYLFTSPIVPVVAKY